MTPTIHDHARAMADIVRKLIIIGEDEDGCEHQDTCLCLDCEVAIFQREAESAMRKLLREVAKELTAVRDRLRQEANDAVNMTEGEASAVRDAEMLDAVGLGWVSAAARLQQIASEGEGESR